MKTFFSKVILPFVLLFIFFSIHSTNYYASSTGTDAAGTSPSSPCSLAAGLSKLVSGAKDTLFLMGGTYNLSSTVKVNKTGTTTARIAIFAYKDEKPVLDFRMQAYGSRGVEFSGAYLHVKGITICYSRKNGFYNSSSYSVFENCETYGNGDTGFQLKSCRGNLIKNCDSHDNFDYQNGGVNTADFGGNADGFADKQYTDSGDPNIYEGCRSWNNSDDGWDFFQRIGNTQIKNSICYKNGPAAYDMTNHPRKTIDATWFSQFPRNVTKVNSDGSSTQYYVTLDNYKNFGNGNGFKFGGDYTAHNVTVTNCLSAQNTVKGFDQNNNAGSMTLYNNTAYNNGTDYGFSNSGYGALVIKNCVTLLSKSSNALKSKSVTNVNNSWNTSGVICNADDFVSTDATQILNSRKADGSLADITFMHLVNGSDLIDKGVTVGLPYSGNAPDLGCYEYGDDIHYPPTVSTPNNMNQGATENIQIEDIIFVWGGSATGLTVSALPDNLNYRTDNSAKTLTIYGTPTAKGVYNYTVTTVGGVGGTMDVSGIIAVSSANAKKIAYVTTPNNDADAAILAKLNSNLEFKTTIVDAAETGIDYSGYDLVIASPTPSSASAGFSAVKTLNKPRLILKPFLFKSGVWSWGTPQNTSQTTMTITNKSHEIFTNLSFSGTNNDELVLFSAVNTAPNSNYAVTGMTGWTNSSPVSQLGVAKDITPTNQSLVEIPIGSTMNATAINSRFLMIGLSEYSTIYLTPTATQLIENSCYYLMGMSVPTSVNKPIKATENYKIIQQGNTLKILTNGETISSIRLFSISGNLLASNKDSDMIELNNLSVGIYVIHCVDKEGNVFIQKLFKK